jgi:hypothetical protein
MVDLPVSPITQPFFASFITSYTRAVLGEILNSFPKRVSVFSVTTDGFLSTATKQDIVRASRNPLYKSFRKARKSLVNDDEALEAKHRIKQPIGWRTRGSATLKKGEGNNDNIVLQKGGIKTYFLFDDEQENSYIVDLFLNRTPDQKIDYTVGVGLKDMVRYGADFVDRSVTKRLSMEFDWKRKPIDAKEVSIKFEGREYTHLSFDTGPLDNFDEFQGVRDAWELYASKDGECLKSKAGFDNFQNFRETKSHPNKAITTYISRKSDGDLKRLRRDLCRAFMHHQAGFNLFLKNCGRFPHAAFCLALVDCGIPCKISDVDNAKRFEFKPNVNAGAIIHHRPE